MVPPHGGVHVEQRAQAAARPSQELRLVQLCAGVAEGGQHLLDAVGAAGDLPAAQQQRRFRPQPVEKSCTWFGYVAAAYNGKSFNSQVCDVRLGTAMANLLMTAAPGYHQSISIWHVPERFTRTAVLQTCHGQRCHDDCAAVEHCADGNTACLPVWGSSTHSRCSASVPSLRTGSASTSLIAGTCSCDGNIIEYHNAEHACLHQDSAV